MIVQLGSRIRWCCTKSRSGTFVRDTNYFLKELKETCINVIKSTFEKIDYPETKNTARCLYTDTADKLGE